MIEILLFFSCFINWNIWMLSISDWAMLGLVIAAVINMRIVPGVDKKKLTAATLIIVACVISLIGNFYKDWFDAMEYFTSFIKLVFYMISVWTISPYLKKKNIDVGRVISSYLYLVAIGAVFQQVVVAILGRGSWPLYSLGSIFFGYPYDNSMFDSGGIMRARTFYMEPGPMAIHIAMLFAVLLFSQKKTTLKLHIAFVVSCVCTLSFSGIAVIFAIYAIYFYNPGNKRKRTALIGTTIALLVIGLYIYNTNFYVRNRITSFLNGTDNSSNMRVTGTLHALLDIPLYGVGVGNNQAFFRRFGQTRWYNGTGDFYNVLVIAAVTMGYLGLFALLIYVYYHIGQNKRLFLAFLVTQFGWGYLYTTPLWMFVILADSLAFYEQTRYEESPILLQRRKSIRLRR